MISHPYYHFSLPLLWTTEIDPTFLSCHIAVCSPSCGKRHLFNPVISCHAPLHTSNGCPSWSEKNPLTLVLSPPCLSAFAPADILFPQILMAHTLTTVRP